jgi:hypothetical protein
MKSWGEMLYQKPVAEFTKLSIKALKGIVSRDFVVCFLVSIDRSDISTHQEWVLMLLKVRFDVEFFDIRVWA